MRPARQTGRTVAVLALMAALALVAVPAAHTPSRGAFGPVASNPADKLVRLPIDAYATTARRAASAVRPGCSRCESWLKRNAGGSSWGIMRCSRLSSGYSLHAEGRALDWRLSVHRRAERREAAG